MEFGMKYMTLMDEISTGLDSAGTFDIIKTQRSIAKNLRKMVAIALLQPAPEVFDLFDNVVIQNEGEVMNHGPRDAVVPYFERLGFVCPPGRDMADFLLDLGTRQQYQYEVPLASGLSKHPRLASEFAERFRESSIHSDVRQMLSEPIRPELVQSAGAHMEPMPEFRQTFCESCQTLTHRQTLILLRNKAFIRVRSFMVVLMGLIYGSTFYNVDPVDVQVMIGVIFQVTLFLSLGQASQIPTFMEAREIFYKQRGANFYRSSAYVIACSLTLVPQALFETLIFGTLVYWMCGFEATAGAFILYIVVLLLTNLVFASWFFCLSAMSPNLDIVKPMSTFSIVIFIFFAGFVITKDDIPDWLIWLYWIDPVAWCMRALSVNQYRSAEFDVCEYGGVDDCSEFGLTMGRYYIKQYQIPDSKEWLWSGVVFVLFGYIFSMALGCYVLEYKRYLAPSNVQLLEKEISDEETNAYTLATTPKHISGTNSGSSPRDGVAVVDIRSARRTLCP